MEGRVVHYDLHGENIMVLNDTAMPPKPEPVEVPVPPVDAGHEDTLRIARIDLFKNIREEGVETHLHSTVADLEEMIRSEGYGDEDVIRAAAAGVYNAIQTSYLRPTTTKSMTSARPVIIDYGMLKSVKSRILATSADSQTFHFYFPFEMSMIRYWAKNGFRLDPRVVVTSYMRNYDPTTFMYKTTRSEPAPMFMARHIKRTFPATYKSFPLYNMLKANLDPDFLYDLIEMYRSIMFHTLNYDRSDEKTACMHFLTMAIVKQDLYTFMMNFVGYDFSSVPPGTPLALLCEEFSYVARMCTHYDIFARPFAHQAYNHLVPFFKAVGLDFDTVRIESKPFEVFEYIRDTIHPDDLHFSQSISKIEYSKIPIIMESLRFVQTSILDPSLRKPDAALDPKAAYGTDLLVDWFVGKYGGFP
jgi:hypothetical protein